MAGGFIIPGVAEVTLHGTVSGTPWINKLHFLGSSTPGAWTAAQLNALCTALFNGWKAAIQAPWPTSTTMSEVTAVDLGSSTPQQGVSTGATFTGGATPASAASTAIMLNFPTNFRYRGGHGRCYVPGAGNTYQATPDTWAGTSFSTWVSGFGTAIANANAAAVGAGVPTCTQCIVMYNYSYTVVNSGKKVIRERIGVRATPPVLAVTGSNQIRSQRRRMEPR